MVSLWTLRSRLGWLDSRTQASDCLCLTALELWLLIWALWMSPGLHTYKTTTLSVEHPPRSQGRHLSWCLQECIILQTQEKKKLLLCFIRYFLVEWTRAKDNGIPRLSMRTSFLPNLSEGFIPKLSPKFL